MLSGRIEPHGSSMASLRPSPSVGWSPDGIARRRPTVAALFAGVAVVALAGLATACAGEPPEVTSDDPELSTGRVIYASNCASCHGAGGAGGVGSRLDQGSMVDAFPDIEDQIDLVADGEGQMPGYAGRLEDAQIRAVVRYTREVL